LPWLRLLVGRLAALIAAAALSGSRLLRAVAALPGGGGLISARVVFLPCPRILIGRLLLLLIVVLRHRVAVVLAGGRLPAAARIFIRGRLLRAIAALTGRGRLVLIALLSGPVRHAECGDRAGVDTSVRLQALAPLEDDQRLRCRPPQYAIRLAAVEAPLLQHDLHLTDLIRAEIDQIAGAAGLRAAE